MGRRRASEQGIFFPWERGKGFLGGRGAARLRMSLAALAMAGVVLLLGARERKAAGLRSTRVTLSLTHAALDSYRADHEGKCPPSLDTLSAEGYLLAPPLDAWQRPLRLTCPGRKDAQGYDLSSDGPDAILGGLDRVE